jgi:hypothetical protein
MYKEQGSKAMEPRKHEPAKGLLINHNCAGVADAMSELTKKCFGR